MTNGWRLLILLECLSIRHEVGFGSGELLFSYHLKEHDKERGQYQINLHHEKEHLLTCLQLNDHGWKRAYFFAKEDMVFGSCGVEDAPTYWKATSEYLHL